MNKLSNWITQLFKKVLNYINFNTGTIINRFNWNNAIKRAYRLKEQYKRDFFVVPISDKKLGVTDGHYPLNKKWLVRLKDKEKRLKYSRLIKLAYYNTIGCSSFKQAKILHPELIRF